MTRQPDTVSGGMVVSIDYVVTLDDGHEVDRSEPGAPLLYLHGGGQIIPGLESAISGMKIAESKEVVVAPEEAYGTFNPDNFTTVPKTAFPDDFDVQEGEEIQVQERETGKVRVAYISEIQNDEVTLDFNHPLAGETLRFDVKVVGIREATSEEISHGHAHESGHSH
jgi:FKBP-type peptidyl-prolyl cis-trans isomerase SlyD